MTDRRAPLGRERRAWSQAVALAAPLAHRAFRQLWLGQSVSLAGDALVQVATVFAVLRIGGSALDIGFVVATRVFASVLFILVGGVWADRLRRNSVMFTADAVRAIVQAVLSGLLFTGRAQVWELALGAALYGAATSFFEPASAGLIPELVPPGQLAQANGLVGFSASFFKVSGPALAGILVAAFSPASVYAVDAATFVVSAFSLATLKTPSRALTAKNSFRADLEAGWHEIASRRWYWLSLAAHGIGNLALPAYFVLGPVIAARSLGGASAWGALSAAWAVGEVTGAVAAMRVRPRRPLLACNFAAILIASCLFALAPPLATWEIGLAAALSGLGVVFANILWTATMQEVFPAEIRSRVNSYDWLVSLVVMPIGFVAAGPIASVVGARATLAGAAILMVLPCALTVLVPGIRAVHRTVDGQLIAPAPAKRREARIVPAPDIR